MSFSSAVHRYAKTEEWKFIAEEFPLRLTHRFAVTKELAQLVVSLCSMPNGSNPTALSKMLEELYQIEGDRRRLVMLLVQKRVAQRPVFSDESYLKIHRIS
jgi:hypothetical protein